MNRTAIVVMASIAVVAALGVATAAIRSATPEQHRRGQAPAAATAPGKATGLQITGQTPTNVTLAWLAPADGGSPITGYTVLRSTNGGQKYAVAPGGSVTSTQATLDAPAAGQTYVFEVKASNAVGTGAPSLPVGAASPGTAAQKLTVRSADGAAVAEGQLSWNVGSGSGEQSSSQPLQLSGTGVVTFSRVAAAAPAKVTLNAGTVATDGRPVSGWWASALATDPQTLRLPAPPAPGELTITVLAPDGTPVPGVHVDSSNAVTATTTVNKCPTTFRIGCVDFTYGLPAADTFASAATTDANGQAVLLGYLTGASYERWAITYDDGSMVQTKAGDISGADTIVHLDYPPAS